MTLGSVLQFISHFRPAYGRMPRRVGDIPR